MEARQEMLDQFLNNNCIDGQDLIEWTMYEQASSNRWR